MQRAPGFVAGGAGGGGGGVNDGRVQRAPAPTGGLGLINIKLRYIASMESDFCCCFFCYTVKKFVEKKNWWSRAGGGGHDPPPPWIRPCCG